MKTAAIILNYNSALLTTRLVNSILLEKCVDDIVIVDNCSTDNSLNELREKVGANCSIIANKENKGYAAGNNIGCKYAITEIGSDILFIANPDVVFHSKYVEYVKEAFEHYPSLAAVTGLMKYPDGKEDKRQYLLFPTYWEDVFNCFALGRKYNKMKLDQRIKVDKEKDINFVPAIPGSLFAVRASMMKEIEYFDENTFLYYEENILGKKIKDAGYKVGLLTNVDYLHDHSATINKNVNYQSKRRIVNKSILYYERQYNKTRGAKLIVLRIALKFSMIDAFVIGKLRSRS